MPFHRKKCEKEEERGNSVERTKIELKMKGKKLTNARDWAGSVTMMK